jgi:hypothetical protein
LCRRARRANDLSSWTLNCLIEAVPASIARDQRLDALLTREWQDYSGYGVRGGATDAEIENIRGTLASAALGSDERREAIVHAGAAGDGGSVPALLSILVDVAEDEAMREQVVDSLAAIGTREAIDGLVGMIVAENQSRGISQMAANTLRHVPASRGSLDPMGRDRLLRWLAILEPSDPRVELILTALEGHPLREGGGVIVELVQMQRINPEIRAAACSAMITVADRLLVQRALAMIELELSENVVATMLRLAVARSVSVPLKWLAREIRRTRSRVRRHQLLKSFVLLVPNGVGGEWNESRHLLGQFFLAAMEDDSEYSTELAKAQVEALSLVSGNEQPYLSRTALNRARDFLAGFTASPGRLSEGRVLLAISVIRHFKEPGARFELVQALDAALSLPPLKKGEGNSDRLALSLANALAELTPVELLKYPADCDPVQSVLRGWAIERHWFVFDDRILDAEGNEIGKATTSGQIAIPPFGPPELAMILAALKKQSQNEFLSFCLTVGANGPCQKADSYPLIYRAIEERVSGEVEDELAGELAALFPDGLPSLEGWRKALTRVEKKFNGQPEMLEFLRRLGLCRRSRQPKRRRG